MKYSQNTADHFRIVYKLFLLFIISNFLIGCQPTPDKDFIAQKDTVAMLEQAKSTPIDTLPNVEQVNETISIREQYSIPETYQFQTELAQGHFKLNINATVEVPSANRIPIVRIEKGQFDPQTIKSIFRLLCEDTEMYYLQDTGVYTKSQIADRLQYLMSSISDEKAYIEENGEEALLEAKERIKDLQSAYANAPDDIEEKRCEGDLVMTQYMNSYQLGIRAISKDNSMFFIAINPKQDVESSLDNSYAFISYSSGTRARPIEGDCFPVNESSASISYTPMQAEEDVKAFLEKAEMHDFNISLVLTPKGQTQDSLDPVYWVQCVRIVSSVKTTYSKEITQAANPSEQFSPEWWYESVDFWIDKNGIFGFNWIAPISIGEIIVEDARLLPFNSIIEIYTKMVNTQYAATMNITEPDLKYGATLQDQYDIDRITLTLQRIQEPDVWDSALLVPVWNFYGINTKTEVEDYQEFNELHYTRESMLSINAIDGSIIDIHKGY